MSVPPDLTVQKKIHDLILKNPGLYLSKIAEITNLNIPTVEYHLLLLKRNNLVTVVNESGFERYYAQKKEEGLQGKRIEDIRQRIYLLILENPGLHLSKIAELLNMRISLVDYHLKCMEKTKEVLATKDEGGYYKRYYIGESGVSIHEKMIISLFRQKIPLQIVLFLLKHANAKYRDIQEYLRISAPLLSYHLNKLVQGGVVDVPGQETKGYYLKNEKEVIHFLKKYRLHALVEKFSDVWSDFDYYKQD